MCEELDLLFAALKIDFSKQGKIYSGDCPIHNGDSGSCYIYRDGYDVPGWWKCETHKCHEKFRSTIIGFTRGVLTSQRCRGDEIYSFKDTVNFLCDVYGLDWKNMKVSVHQGRSDINNFLKSTTPILEDSKIKMSRMKVIKELQIPAPYYLERGYSAEILTRYDIGMCMKSGKKMSGRVVVPVYDENGEYMIGCSGRSIHPLCEKCRCYHNPSFSCLSKEQRFAYSKWKHEGFKSSNTLYNYCWAKSYIQKSKSAILVESPGNVWRLEEVGIHNSVALFGNSFSIAQQFLLEKLGVMDLVVVFDNDENQSGQKASKALYDECSRYYNIRVLTVPKNDIGDMSANEVRLFFKEQLNV